MSKALILAKTEGANYGVDAAPVKTTDAILTTIPKFSVAGKSLERNVVMGTFGSLGRVNVGEGLKISFGVEMAGSGTATTPPRLSPLFKSLSFTEAVDADSVDYTPNSDVDTVGSTIYFHYEDRLHKLLGCVGESLKLTAKAGEFATAELSFIGLYAGSHASDLSTPSDATFLQGSPPVFKSATATIGAYTPVLASLELTITNTISAARNANAAVAVSRYRVKQRKVEGTMVVDAPTLATWNPWSLWDATTAAAIAATIGATAGNKWVISVPNAVPADPPEYSEADAAVQYTYKFVAGVTLTAGNNEVTFSHR